MSAEIEPSAEPALRDVVVVCGICKKHAVWSDLNEHWSHVGTYSRRARDRHRAVPMLRQEYPRER